MKLIDYIKSTRRGREANRIEREAMGDPFLSDAIEGFDAVYGNHPDKLKSLEEIIAKRAARRRRKTRTVSVTDVPESVPHLLPVGDKDPGHGTATGRVESAHRPSEKDGDNTGSDETIRREARPGNDADRKASSAAAESRRSPEAAGKHTDDSTLSEEKTDTSGEGAGAAGGENSVILGEKPAPKRRRLRWLGAAIAAAVILAMAGGAWYYFEYAMPEKAAMIAMEERGIPVTEPYVADAAGQATPETVDSQEEALESESVPQQPVVVERPAHGKRAETGPPPAVVQKKEAGRTADIDGGAIPAAAGMEFDTVTIVAQRLPVAAAVIMESEEDNAVSNVPDTPAKILADDAYAGNGKERTASVGNKAEQDAGSASKAITAGETEAAADKRTAPDESQAKAETVRNEDFVNYFNENRTLHDVSGTVVMEFRVNPKGVPSGIKVISSPSAKAGQEAVRLLVSGPKWTPSNGKRIRTAVEY